MHTPEYLPGRSIPSGYKPKIWEIARKREIAFLDYNKELSSPLNYDESLYADWYHLNRRGAERFSAMLSAHLVGIIPTLLARSKRVKPPAAPQTERDPAGERPGVDSESPLAPGSSEGDSKGAHNRPTSG